MSISKLLGFTIALIMSGPVWATPIVGRSVLKIQGSSQSTGPVRQARVAIEKINKKIRRLDHQLLMVHSNATLATVRSASSMGQAERFQALEQDYRLERARLVAERNTWKNKLKASNAAPTEVGIFE